MTLTMPDFMPYLSIFEIKVLKLLNWFIVWTKATRSAYELQRVASLLQL